MKKAISILAIAATLTLVMGSSTAVLAQSAGRLEPANAALLMDFFVHHEAWRLGSPRATQDKFFALYADKVLVSSQNPAVAQAQRRRITRAIGVVWVRLSRTPDRKAWKRALKYLEGATARRATRRAGQADGSGGAGLGRARQASKQLANTDFGNSLSGARQRARLGTIATGVRTGPGARSSRGGGNAYSWKQFQATYKKHLKAVEAW